VSAAEEYLDNFARRIMQDAVATAREEQQLERARIWDGHAAGWEQPTAAPIQWEGTEAEYAEFRIARAEACRNTADKHRRAAAEARRFAEQVMADHWDEIVQDVAAERWREGR